MKRDPLPSTFAVHDERGRAWPPGFRSQLTDPTSPHTMVSANQLASARAKEAREQAAREGKGWANGTLESLAKKGYVPGDVPSMHQKPFRFRPSSIAERVYVYLRENGASDATTIGKALHLKSHEIRPFLTPAIRAGVILARRVEANRVMFEVGHVIEVAG